MLLVFIFILKFLARTNILNLRLFLVQLSWLGVIQTVHKHLESMIIFHFLSRFGVILASAGLNLPETVKFRRNRLDMTKANNFIDFIFTSGMV